MLSRQTRKVPVRLISVPQLLFHLVSGAANKHVVVILPGSPVTSEHTQRTAHGEAVRPSNVTELPFSLSVLVTVQWSTWRQEVIWEWLWQRQRGTGSLCPTPTHYTTSSDTTGNSADTNGQSFLCQTMFLHVWVKLGTDRHGDSSHCLTTGQALCLTWLLRSYHRSLLCDGFILHSSCTRTSKRPKDKTAKRKIETELQEEGDERKMKEFNNFPPLQTPHVCWRISTLVMVT